MRKQHIYKDIYYKPFNLARFIKVYFIFPSLMLVFTIHILEVDFVAMRGEQTLYVQTVYLLGSEETIAREFGNLQAIRDNYPKYVVSMDPVSGDLPEYPGIMHVHLHEFLMSDF